jgi:hypothetical protein
MADNIGYTPGDGATVAADEIGGVLHQRVKLALGADGVNDGDLSAANPMPVAGSLSVDNFPAQVGLTDAQLRAEAVPVNATGELIEAIEAMRMAVQSLTRTMGQMQPDTAARMRVAVDSISGGLTLTTVSTVNTVATLTNQAQIGGLAATEHIPSLMRLGADSVRRNITTS